MVLNQLYKFSPLQESQSLILLALVDGKPRELTLKEMLTEFIRHRVSVIRRRTQFLLAKARRRKHTVEGLLLALANIDEIIKTIRTSRTQPEAKQRLMGIECPASMMQRACGDDGFRQFQLERGVSDTYTLTSVQTDEILKMRLGQLVNLEQEKLSDEHKQLLEEIADYLDILGSQESVYGIIKADLTPKLQNAQDEQAIYEFLQNAADSQSTECAVIYNDTYFMVINNGKAFTEKDLKALLNSFQGTKADKTKEENCGKIGRYGIGFKLAYRLMGKSDGAEELLRDLAGPLLFSWHNREQWQGLLDYKGTDLSLNDAIDTDVAPWLLKIILACFPTAPGEVVKDLDYQDQTLFDPAELTQLVAFLNEHQEQLAGFSLEQGSLFFLRFGPKKHEKLQTSLLNIRSGIGYAMNTLKTLEKVALQEDVIERYPTTLERYAILPGTADFERIDPEFPNCPIDISLGFPKSLEQMLALKKAPSLYQFFPMRNERHNMAYFIHSSSFAKITARTRLDDQGEANVETFQYIHKALERSLKRLQQDDAQRFCHYYQALLLTDRSTEYDAPLINTHLYDPILSYLKENIPTNKGNFYTKDLVIVKATQLPVEPMSLGIGKEWFHWAHPETDADSQRAAVNSAKLDLKKWGLKELVLEANLTLLNNLIQQLAEADYQQFVKELKDVDFDPVFAERFAQLKAFKFTKQGGGAQFYALHDLQDQADLFLMSDRLLPIKEAIKGLGFSVLEFEVSDYAMILQQVKLPLDYLTKDSALFDK